MFGPPPLGPGAPPLDATARLRPRPAAVRLGPIAPCCPTPTAIRRCGSTRRPCCTAPTSGCCSRPQAPRATSTRRPMRCWHCWTPTTSTTSSIDRGRRRSRARATRGRAWRASCAGRVSHSWVLHVDLDQFLAVGRIAPPPRTGRPAGHRRRQRRPDRTAQGGDVRVLRGARIRRARRHAAAHRRAQVPRRDLPALDPAAYDEASEEVMGLLRDLGHPLEVWGWDEAYLGADVDRPVRAGRAHPRRSSTAETGLSCSVGISDNKQRAKVATGFGKPARAMLPTHRRQLDGGDGRPRRRRAVGRRPEDRQNDLPAWASPPSPTSRPPMPTC